MPVVSIAQRNKIVSLPLAGTAASPKLHGLVGVLAKQQKRAGGIIKHNTNAVKNLAATQAVPGDNDHEGSSPEPPAKKVKQPAKPAAGGPARGRGGAGARVGVLALPFGGQSQGRVVIQVTVEHNEDREDQPTTPLPGVLPPALSKQFFRCALTAIAICTGPQANPELPTVEQLVEAIAATISQRTDTPPELQHAQWLTDTMTAAGVEMYLHHTELTLLRVGDDNLCAISLGKEDEELADTLRLAVALTSPVALLRAIRLRTIVIYLTESEFDPSELLIHPFSQTIREAGELGGNTGQNQIRRAAIGLRKKAWKTAPASLAMRATGSLIYTLTLPLTAHHHSIIGGTRSTDITAQWRKTVSTACWKIKAAPAPAPTERRLVDTSPAPPPADPL
eukprot:jgi/Tetstr1/444409/TSEL_032298.t1